MGAHALYIYLFLKEQVFDFTTREHCATNEVYPRVPTKISEKNLGKKNKNL